MEYTIQGLSKLAGVSARTLRYYDEIDLLKPCRINSSGYRIYGSKEVNMLQQILFYKELGLELLQIKKILYQKDFNRLEALTGHLKALKEKQTRVDLLIKNVTKTILEEEGKRKMSDQEKFEGLKHKLIKENEKSYGKEIREKFGEDVVKESNAKLLSITQKEYGDMEALGKTIREALEKAVINHVLPDSEEGKKIASLHKKWLSYTWKQYSKEAHKNLVEMYVADERFTAYYDAKVKGCAAFLRDAVHNDCSE